MENRIMRYKPLFESSKITKGMKDFFLKRTKNHIKLVGKYLDKILALNLDYIDPSILKEEKRSHDESKFGKLEVDPYIFLTWMHKCKNDNTEFCVDKNTQDDINQATKLHVTTNKHHPDSWSNIKDMTPSYLACMVADWCAMSEEFKNNTPREWAKKVIPSKWKFTKEQQDIIYSLIDKIW